MPGATVLVYYKEDFTFYLVSGYESNYPSQKTIPADTKSQEAFVKLDEEWLTDPTKHYVIEKESKLKDEGRYTIRSKVNDKFGFPKGLSKEGESPIVTAKREFEEEVGYSALKDYRLKILPVTGSNKSDYTIFTYQLKTPKEMKDIKEAIAKMKEERKGELFEVDFRSLEEIKEMPLNSKSKLALRAFERSLTQIGSSREKTRKRKRAKHQT